VPPRPSNRAVWIIASVIAVLLLACFGISATGFLVLRSHDLAARTTPDGEPGAAPSYPNPTGPPIQKHTGDLDRYVIAAPAGSHAWPNKPIDEQLPDYHTAGKTFADAATFTPILSRYNFQRGVLRRWVDADGTIVAVRLFQFGLTQFADAFAQDMKQTDELQGWSAPTPLPAAAGAETQVRPGEAGRIHSVGVLVKDELVVVVDTSQVPPNKPTTLADLVTQESKLLH
jgi:hypothetical protein